MQSVVADVVEAQKDIAEVHNDVRELVDESRKRPEDVAAAMNEEAMGMAKAELQGKLEEAIDPLEDLGLFPFDLLGQALKNMAPACMARVSQKFQRFVSKLGMSGFIHLIMVEMLPVYFFCYSVYNILVTMLIEAKKEENNGLKWPSFDKVQECLHEFAQGLIWLEGHIDSKQCYDEKITSYPMTSLDDETLRAKALGIINYGCLLSCGLLWLLVVGSFLCRARCVIRRVPFQSGEYLQFSYSIRQTFLYRYLAGLIALGALLSIVAVAAAAAQGGLLKWFLETQLVNLVMVVLSARAFIVPTKPKFNFKHVDFAELRFNRGSFFQTNGSFATILGNALLQCSRSKQFRRSLMDRLDQPNDWEHVMKVCLLDKVSTSTEAERSTPDV